MPKPRRLNIPGATYHVMNRGNRKAAIFEDNRDRRYFLETLLDTQEIYGVKTLGGSLMTNHFHLVIQTPHGNLSDFMEQFEGRFARHSNWRHRHCGHLFQGPFRSVLIEHDIHLLTALCYVFMNPVVARLAARLEDYKWSTYAATAGFETAPEYLSIEWLTTLFPAKSLKDSQRLFREIMSEPLPVVAYVQSNELDVAPEAIKGVLRSYTGGQLHLARMPRLYRTALRPPLSKILTGDRTTRATEMYEARVVFGYRVAEIAKAANLRPATVSKILCAYGSKRRA